MSASEVTATPRPNRPGAETTSTPPQAIICEYEAPGGEPFPSPIERLRATAMTVNSDSPTPTLYPPVMRV